MPSKLALLGHQQRNSYCSDSLLVDSSWTWPFLGSLERLNQSPLQMDQVSLEFKEQYVGFVSRDLLIFSLPFRIWDPGAQTIGGAYKSGS